LKITHTVEHLGFDGSLDLIEDWELWW